MPEISDTQRPQLDSFYALVGLCSLTAPSEEASAPSAGLTGWQVVDLSKLLFQRGILLFCSCC